MASNEAYLAEPNSLLEMNKSTVETEEFPAFGFAPTKVFPCQTIIAEIIQAVSRGSCEQGSSLRSGTPPQPSPTPGPRRPWLPGPTDPPRTTDRLQGPEDPVPRVSGTTGRGGLVRVAFASWGGGDARQDVPVSWIRRPPNLIQLAFQAFEGDEP